MEERREVLWARAGPALEIVEWLRSLWLLRPLFVVVERVALLFFVLPLLFFWLYAPSVGGVGGQGGRTPSQMCAAWSPRTHEEDWLTPEGQRVCNHMVVAAFDEFLTLVGAVIYLLALTCGVPRLLRFRGLPWRPRPPA